MRHQASDQCAVYRVAIPRKFKRRIALYCLQKGSHSCWVNADGGGADSGGWHVCHVCRDGMAESCSCHSQAAYGEEEVS